MRNGYRVYDSDTHIGPSADTLDKYLSSRVRELCPTWKAAKCPKGGTRQAWSTIRRTRRAFASAAAGPLAVGEPMCRACSARQCHEPRHVEPPASSWARSIRNYTATTGMPTDACAIWT